MEEEQKSTSKQETKETLREAVNQGQMNTKALTLALYLIIFANFLLGVVIANPILKFELTQENINLILVVYFFIFFILFEVGSLYYINAIKRVYKKNEVRFISWALVIAYVGGFFLSYKFLGLAN